MTRDQILRAFDSIRVWQQCGQRAVREALLVLYALGKVGVGQTAMMR